MTATHPSQLARDIAPTTPTAPTAIDKHLVDRLFSARAKSTTLTAPLSDEDQVVQVNEDASPAKWHLAHTTWFFESFILRDFLPGYEPFSEDFEYCFNSYYDAKGQRHPRALRGLLTRPSCQEVRNYRNHVDKALERLTAHEFSDAKASATVATLIELGINHEQQHQELLLTDILALFASQPLKPAYRQQDEHRSAKPSSAPDMEWISYRGGVQQVGHRTAGFSYDNEGPCHHILIHPFKLSNRCVTNAEWLEFINDGGYKNALFWLADGWKTVQDNHWSAPRYWQSIEGSWHQMTLAGLLPIDLGAPVCHVSYYEADAYACWAQSRLPTEFEWEIAANGLDISTAPPCKPRMRPVAAHKTPVGQPSQMFGDVWQWTQSAYQPYPGYKTAPGAIGEYNGKFMCSQQVLRGSSCVTSPGHSRTTYRNFFYPHQRWQFTGLRLVKDLS